MTLWAVLTLAAVLAGAFHWMAAHRERDDVRALRTLYWGDPLLQALILDLLCLGIIVLLVLRAVGVDLPALIVDGTEP